MRTAAVTSGTCAGVVSRSRGSRRGTSPTSVRLSQRRHQRQQRLHEGGRARRAAPAGGGRRAGRGLHRHDGALDERRQRAAVASGGDGLQPKGAKGF
jgi:hypothetical protein